METEMHYEEILKANIVNMQKKSNNYFGNILQYLVKSCKIIYTENRIYELWI